MNEATDRIDRGLCIRQADYTPQGLDAAIIKLAIEHGWRGARTRDYRTILSLLAATNEDAQDGQAIAEDLGWVADDATSYLNEVAPEGCWVGHDGEAGYFGVWTTEGDDA